MVCRGHPGHFRRPQGLQRVLAPSQKLGQDLFELMRAEVGRHFGLSGLDRPYQGFHKPASTALFLQDLPCSGNHGHTCSAGQVLERAFESLCQVRGRLPVLGSVDSCGSKCGFVRVCRGLRRRKVRAQALETGRPGHSVMHWRIGPTAHRTLPVSARGVNSLGWGKLWVPLPGTGTAQPLGHGPEVGDAAAKVFHGPGELPERVLAALAAFGLRSSRNVPLSTFFFAHELLWPSSPAPLAPS